MGPSDSNNQSARVFVAIPVPDQITEELKRWRNINIDKLLFRKWTHPQDYHITLQFLGEISVIKLDALMAALKNIKGTPFPLALNGIGFFGSSKTPRVLWAGVSGDLNGLQSLHLSVIQETGTLGFIPEDRPYSPHITLARRFKEGEELLLEAITPAPVGLEWVVDHFSLMRTHLNVSPMYENVETFTLV
ncbi:2'-5' RNA ligase [Paenibacillus anaericanus]|uniref:RNA 2',3'-cyclic phosphodiesterase n=1 Tax=Paenibacillus anaericanus TaxID=170367 RepID=UPI002781B9D1|nr:RNA 2',3'-cyclic phosphodiesterase [Paenibacillus anaericanus]MDQ0086870.1 2'-5' RNA ligase [Paenibacillus anaericanus]